MAGSGGRERIEPFSPLGLIGVLTMLAKTNELYYLHQASVITSSNSMRSRTAWFTTKNTAGRFAPAAVAGQKSNCRERAFWSRVETQAFAPITRAVSPPDPNAPYSGRMVAD